MGPREHDVEEMCKIHKNEDGSIIENFYNDQSSHAFALQIGSFSSRLRFLEDAISHLEESTKDKEIVFVERSLWTDFEVFAPALNKAGKISDLHYSIYNEHFRSRIDSIYQKLAPYKIMILYLKTTPQECKSRCDIRGRHEEKDISVEYLALIHNNHEAWLDGEEDIKVINVDGSLDQHKIVTDVVAEIENI